ncbi:CoA-binding protein [Polaribacter pacificus]|uniref:CoA-binding protein n=1 Tax=Polaribacter pacificus TaxID=1775173 RepID=A0A917I1A5_9FLAO|nr:CoA-binding protein [Polaribacter pacificus]GGH01211.1 CoA-binding protein [Polaribacter pacificus]
MKNETLVIGASLNPDRYSNRAVRALRANKYPVKAIGIKEGTVEDVVIETQKNDFKNIDTVSLYLNPERQKEYYDYIISLKPRRVIFNPGTENAEFESVLKKAGIFAEVACTLVLLRLKQYS